MGEEVFHDPDFHRQPDEVKERTLKNYFHTELADDEYYNLPQQRRDKILDNFYASVGYTPPKPFAEKYIPKLSDWWTGVREIGKGVSDVFRPGPKPERALPVTEPTVEPVSALPTMKAPPMDQTLRGEPTTRLYHPEQEQAGQMFRAEQYRTQRLTGIQKAMEEQPPEIYKGMTPETVLQREIKAEKAGTMGEVTQPYVDPIDMATFIVGGGIPSIIRTGISKGVTSATAKALETAMLASATGLVQIPIGVASEEVAKTDLAKQYPALPIAFNFIANAATIYGIDNAITRLRATDTWPMMSEPERGLVTQSIEEIKSSGLTKGQKARRFADIKSAEIEKRVMPPEEPTIPVRPSGIDLTGEPTIPKKAPIVKEPIDLTTGEQIEKLVKPVEEPTLPIRPIEQVFPPEPIGVTPKPSALPPTEPIDISKQPYVESGTKVKGTDQYILKIMSPEGKEIGRTIGDKSPQGHAEALGGFLEKPTPDTFPTQSEAQKAITSSKLGDTHEAVQGEDNLWRVLPKREVAKEPYQMNKDEFKQAYINATSVRASNYDLQGNLTPEGKFNESMPYLTKDQVKALAKEPSKQYDIIRINFIKQAVTEGKLTQDEYNSIHAKDYGKWGSDEFNKNFPDIVKPSRVSPIPVTEGKMGVEERAKLLEKAGYKTEADKLRAKEVPPTYNKSHLEWIKDVLASMEASKKIEGNIVTGGYPEWFRNKGYTKLQVNVAVNKVIKDKTLTSKQQDMLDDLTKSSLKDYKIVGREKIYPDELAEGQKVIIKGEEYTRQGTKLVDGEDIEIDPLEKIAVDKILPKETKELQPPLELYKAKDANYEIWQGAKDIEVRQYVKGITDEQRRLGRADFTTYGRYPTIEDARKAIEKEGGTFIKSYKEEFKLTPEEVKAQKVKPTEQQLPLGTEKTALEGKIPTVETPETAIERATREAEARKAEAEMKAKQGVLPEGKVTKNIEALQKRIDNLKNNIGKFPEGTARHEEMKAGIARAETDLQEYLKDYPDLAKEAKGGLSDIFGNKEFKDISDIKTEVEKPIEKVSKKSKLYSGIPLSEAIEQAKRVADIAGEKTGLSELIEGLQKKIVPATLSDKHLEAAQTLGKWLGEKQHKLEQTNAKVRPTYTFFAKNRSGVIESDGVKLTPNESFMERVDKGEKQPTPELQKLADMSQDISTKQKERLGGIDPEMVQGWDESFFPRIVKKQKDVAKALAYIQSKRPFETRKSFAKRRNPEFETLLDLKKAGFELITDNPAEMMLIREDEVTRFEMAKGFLDEINPKITAGEKALEKMGLSGKEVLFIKAGKPVPEGYDKIADPFGQVWYRTEKGERVLAGYRVLPTGYADILNNYLSPTVYSRRYIGKLARNYMYAGGTLNNFQLAAFSGFHSGFTTGDVMVSHIAFIIEDLVDVLRGTASLKDLGKSVKQLPLAWVTVPIRGGKIKGEWFYTGEHPEMSYVVRAMELAGAKIHVASELAPRVWDDMVYNWYSGHKMKAAIQSPLAIVELSARPLRDMLVPNQKVAIFKELVDRIMRNNRGKKLEDLVPQLRKTWNRVDQSLGQVIYTRIFMHNIAKNIGQFLIRAPGWSGGTPALFGGSLKDVRGWYQEFRNTGKMPPIPDRVAYTITLLVSGAILNGTLTYIFTGQQPHGSDFWAFRTGREDERGRPERFVLPSYNKDIYAYGTNPTHTILAKLHPMLSIAADVLMNRDYYNTQIHDPNDNFVHQRWDDLKYTGKQFEPFWMRGVQKEVERKAGVVKTVVPLVGVMPASSAYTETAALKEAHKYRWQPTEGYTKEEAAKRKLKSDLEKEVRVTGSTEVIDQSDLTSKEKKELKALSKLTPIQRATYRMPIEKLKKVYKLSTLEEKDDIERMKRKQMRNEKLSEEQQNKLYREFKKLTEE